MQTPYQNGAQITRGQPGRIPVELIDGLGSRCISEDSDIKGFEYYSKLSEFYEYRLDNGMEIEAVPRMFNPEIPADCPEEVVTDMWGYVDYIYDHSYESLGYGNRSQLIGELFSFLEA